VGFILIISLLCNFLIYLWQIRDFERNGLNLTSTKKEEVQHLQARIDDLSMQYIQNLNDDGSFLLFTKTELEGLPAEFLQVIFSEFSIF